MKNDLEAITARVKAASPGPWIVRKLPSEQRIGTGFVQAPRLDPSHGYDIEVLCEDGNYPDERREGDLQFIAAARQDIPELVGECAVMRRVLAALDALADPEGILGGVAQGPEAQELQEAYALAKEVGL